MSSVPRFIRLTFKITDRRGLPRKSGGLAGYAVASFIFRWGSTFEKMAATMSQPIRVRMSTHNLALSALLFLYREVFCVQLPWLDDLHRPTHPRRIPTVLTVAEVAALLGAMTGLSCGGVGVDFYTLNNHSDK